jgi:predicted dehydrogenase
MPENISSPVLQHPAASAKPLRAVVIGLGEGAAQIMLPAITAQPNVQLIAACDLDEHTRQRSATRWQIPQVYAPGHVRSRKARYHGNCHATFNSLQFEPIGTPT